MASWYLAQGSTYAADIDNLILLIGIIVGVWFIAAELVLFWLIFRFRARPGVAGQYIAGEEKREKRWVSYPHYAVLVFDVIILVFALRVWNDIKIIAPGTRKRCESSPSSGPGPSSTRDLTASSIRPTTFARSRTCTCK